MSQTVTTWNDLLHPGAATDFFARGTFPRFDPTTGGYSDGNALWLAELSRLVYRHDIEEENPPPQPTRSSFLAKAGLRQRQFFISPSTDTQATLVESEAPPTFAVLVFRGTEQNPKDFITDIEIGTNLLESEAVSIHEGFRRALDSVWKQQIEPELSKLTCPVFYTGHSLGAALATLAVALRAPRALYTFGSPRVGNEAFARSLMSIPIYRVVDDEDVVTRVPPEILGFRHVGEEHTLKEAEVKPSLHPIVWLRRLFGPPKPLADHAPVNYVDRILRLIGET